MYRRRYFSDGQVTTPQIIEGAITEDKLAPDAVTSPKIKNATVQTEDIADKAVTLAKLGDDVPAVGIPDNSISAAKLADNAVEKRHIKTASVDTDELANDSVTSDKLRDASVTPTKLSFSVPTRPLTPPIATDEIANLSVTYDKIANYSVNDEKLSNGAVTTPKVGDLQITNAKLQDASITPPKVDAVNVPTDGQALTYEAASSRFKYATAGGSKITLINPQAVFDETATSDRSAPLDLSTVIPATAVGVLVELHQNGMIPGWAQPSAQIQHSLGGVALTCYITGDAAGTHPHYADNAGIVPVYASQQIYLVINRVGVSTRVKVTVTGYIE